MKGRCGGIGRHAVLRGQWGNPCQFESGHRHRIARGIKARCFMHACKILMMMLFAGQAHALLLGEKARNAPIAGLKSALLRYKLGETHESVWQHTRWYCPFRNHIGCRWEIADNCTSVNHLNITRLKHSSFTGKVPLWKVFNVACVWQRYPSLKKQIFIYYEGTRDATEICNFKNEQDTLGYAWRFQEGDRGICLNIYQLSQKGNLHLIFLHELQHHIQLIENFPKFNENCPYERRMLEEEAFYVERRESLTRKEKLKQAPEWFIPGLC